MVKKRAETEARYGQDRPWAGPAGLRGDVIVVGGGPAGMCAAIAAAREGAGVVLVEQANACGGMATQGLVGPFMTCYDRPAKVMIIRGLFEEIVQRMVDRGYAIHPAQVHAGTCFTSWIVLGHEHVTPFEPEGLKLIMDEMIQEAGVKVLYHTCFLRPLMERDRIAGGAGFLQKGTGGHRGQGGHRLHRGWRRGPAVRRTL